MAIVSKTKALSSFISPRRIHHAILDCIDSRIGRSAAIAFHQISPLFLSTILSAKFLNYVSLIQPSIFIILELPLFFLGSIVTFRYFTDTYREEIGQMIQDSNGKAKNVLIIETTDWTQEQIKEHPLIKFFAGDSRLCGLRLDVQKLRKTFSIKRLFAHSEKQLNEALKSLKDKSIDVLWIRGHGNSEKIHFNEKFSFDRRSKALMQTIAKKSKNTAFITLSACSTGKGDYNIAKILSSYCPNATVRAPEDVIGPSTFYNDDLFPFYFDLNGQKVQTCVFQNGQKLR